MRDGFIKVAAGTPKIKVADCGYNAEQIITLMKDAAAQGVKVLSISAGTVDQVYTDGLMGTTVVVDHGGGLQSWYCNLAEDVLVEAGDKVDIGGELGIVGATAIAEGGVPSHIHLETILNGQPVDPREDLK